MHILLNKSFSLSLVNLEINMVSWTDKPTVSEGSIAMFFSRYLSIFLGVFGMENGTEGIPSNWAKGAKKAASKAKAARSGDKNTMHRRRESYMRCRLYVLKHVLPDTGISSNAIVWTTSLTASLDGSTISRTLQFSQLWVPFGGGRRL